MPGASCYGLVQRLSTFGNSGRARYIPLDTPSPSCIWIAWHISRGLLYPKDEVLEVTIVWFFPLNPARLRLYHAMPRRAKPRLCCHSRRVHSPSLGVLGGGGHAERKHPIQLSSTLDTRSCIRRLERHQHQRRLAKITSCAHDACIRESMTV